MPEESTRTTRSPLGPIFLIVLVDVLGLTIVLPLLPLYAERFGATAFTASLLVPAYAACQMVAGPILGGLSDRFGRRRILLISQLGTFTGFVIIANAHSLWLIFVGRLLDGFTAGNLSIAQAYIADNTKPEDRAKSFALIGIAFGVGFMLGPALAGYLAQYGMHVPFLAAAGLSALSILCTATLLPKGGAPKVDQGATPAGKRPGLFDFAEWGRQLRRPVIGGILAEFFVYLFVFSMFMSGFALFAERRYSMGGAPFGPKEIGLLYGLAGLVGIVIQGGLLGRMVRRFGEAKLITVGLAVMGTGFLLLPQVTPIRGLVFAVFCVACGNALLRPNLTSLLSRAATRHEQGVVLGLSQSLSSLANILAAPLSGFLIEKGHFQLWAVVATVGCGLALILRRWGSAQVAQLQQA
jgi:DHA1 family tetracycline resistance protein-like MFS transporter